MLLKIPSGNPKIILNDHIQKLIYALHTKNKDINVNELKEHVLIDQNVLYLLLVFFIKGQYF